MFIFINVNPSLNKSLLWKYFLHILLTIFTILTLARKTDIVSNKHNLLFTLNRQNQISSSIVRLFKEILRGCRLCKNYIMNSFCDKERTSFYSISVCLCYVVRTTLSMVGLTLYYYVLLLFLLWQALMVLHIQFTNSCRINGTCYGTTC